MLTNPKVHILTEILQVWDLLMEEQYELRLAEPTRRDLHSGGVLEDARVLDEQHELQQE